MSLLGPALVCVLASAAAALPEEVEIPKLLTLDDALKIFHARGFDLLLADAAVLSAEGDVLTAKGVFNPTFSVGAGPTFNYSSAPPCVGCDRFALNWSITDTNATMDSLVGKRGLRVRISEAALGALRLNRTDAQRKLDTQLKVQYLQVVLAKESLDFALDVQRSMSETFELNKFRYPGVIDEGALARVEIQKLEADQAVAIAVMTLRQAKVGLAFLLGVRSEITDFGVETELLNFRIPPALGAASERALLDRAFDVRPDLQAFRLQVVRAEAALDLAEKLRFPDIALGLTYSQIGTGQGALTPPNILFGLTLALPVFYQQQGEIRRAQADLDTQSIQREKTASQIVADIHGAYAAYIAARELVERMETTLLARAKTARDIVDFQYKKGAASLTDFLDAERTFIATRVEYRQDLIQYWTAVFQLEQAVGMELR